MCASIRSSHRDVRHSSSAVSMNNVRSLRGTKWFDRVVNVQGKIFKELTFK